MGHLLSSINSAAAEAIQPEERLALPPVCSMVLYTMRPGYGRRGQTKFPAIVMSHSNRGTLGLLVFVDAGEIMDEDLVQPAGPGNEFHVWEKIEDDHAGLGQLRAMMLAQGERLAEMRAELSATKAMIMGDFKAPPVPLFSIFADMEKRLKALESKKGSK